jgi:hypothetical protein
MKEVVTGWISISCWGGQEMHIAFCSGNLLEGRHFLGMPRGKTENSIKLIIRK